MSHRHTIRLRHANAALKMRRHCRHVHQVGPHPLFATLRVAGIDVRARVVVPGRWIQIETGRESGWVQTTAYGVRELA